MYDRYIGCVIHLQCLLYHLVEFTEDYFQSESCDKSYNTCRYRICAKYRPY